METSNSINPIAIFKWIILGVGVFVIFSLLKKFNILGTSANTEEAKALGEDAALRDSVTNITADPKNIFLLAIKKKFGNKPTAAQLNTLLPHKAAMPKMVTSIKFDAHHNFTQNDASVIMNAFKTLASQYEINFFATLYGITTGQDMYGSLDNLMHDSDMAKLRSIINSKPVI